MANPESGRDGLSAAAVALLDAIYKRPEIPPEAFTAEQAAQRWGVTMAAARCRLQRLLGTKQLQSTKRGQIAYYHPPLAKS